MPLIIDGCNLLGSMNQLFRPRSDEFLIEDFLLPYLRIKPKKVVVVFDNSDYNSYEKNDLWVEGIHIIYTIQGVKTADDVINDFIRKTNHPEGTTIVSSDRDIVNNALLHHCKVIKSEDFVEEVRGVIRVEEEIEIDNSEKELDQEDIDEINEELMKKWKI